MKSRIWLGGEWVSAPKFAIGDAVVHVYDGPLDDDASPYKWLVYWYRGVVIGKYYNRNTNKLRQFRDEGWVYLVEVEDGCDGTGIANWLSPWEKFQEHELKSSYLHRRVIQARIQWERNYSPVSPLPPVLIARCKAG